MAFLAPHPLSLPSSLLPPPRESLRRPPFKSLRRSRNAHFPPTPRLPPRTIRMDAASAGVYSNSTPPSQTHVIIFGATGYIGRNVVRQFLEHDYLVTAFARPRAGVSSSLTASDTEHLLSPAVVKFGDVTNPEHIKRAFENPPPETRATLVVSCLASRTGGIQDSVLIDYQASSQVLKCAIEMNVRHFILLSAVCVAKPELEFQRQKLRFEAELEQMARQDETFSYCIVRPTAFFKSLAAQIDRVKKGSPFIMFGNGDLCKCNALSERDLAEFIVRCAGEEELRNRILPIGGPGGAVNPREQALILFRLLGKEPKFWTLPIAIMDFAVAVLDFVALGLPFVRDAAEFGKIGRYYAVEDMVAPEVGSDTLEMFFRKALEEGGMDDQQLGDAAIF